MKKLKLSELKVKSFVTKIKSPLKIKGGGTGWGYCDTEWEDCSLMCTDQICDWTNDPVKCYGNQTNGGDCPGDQIPIDND